MSEKDKLEIERKVEVKIISQEEFERHLKERKKENNIPILTIDIYKPGEWYYG